MVKFDDVKNAFYCVPWELLQRYVSFFTNKFGKKVAEKVIENHVVVKECADGVLYVFFQGGVPLGLFCATSMFNSVYSQMLEPYSEDTKYDTNMLNVENVVSEGSISTAHTMFVDDLASGVAPATFPKARCRA